LSFPPSLTCNLLDAMYILGIGQGGGERGTATAIRGPIEVGVEVRTGTGSVFTP